MHLLNQKAPELQVSTWLNSKTPLSLESLRGKVVVLHSFQMLCPGCVQHGLPQAGQIHELFDPEEVQVIGLHSVFEHHSVMNEAALRAFLSEYRIKFPIAIDKSAERGAIPLTMRKYKLQGTPSTVIIDQSGEIRMIHFGQISDLRLGSIIGRIVAEQRTPIEAATSVNAEIITAADATKCDDNGCKVF